METNGNAGYTEACNLLILNQIIFRPLGSRVHAPCACFIPGSERSRITSGFSEGLGVENPSWFVLFSVPGPELEGAAHEVPHKSLWSVAAGSGRGSGSW